MENQVLMQRVPAILGPVHKNIIIGELDDAIVLQVREMFHGSWFVGERCRQDQVAARLEEAEGTGERARHGRSNMLEHFG